MSSRLTFAGQCPFIATRWKLKSEEKKMKLEIQQNYVGKIEKRKLKQMLLFLEKKIVT